MILRFYHVQGVIMVLNLNFYFVFNVVMKCLKIY